MFRKLLIANRGEIAVRVIRACRELDIKPIAVYSEADRLSPHVWLAEEAIPIGPAPARASYLNVEAILAAARRSRADAIHPGYGFLAESAEFARRVEEAGLTFVGPGWEAIGAMGDKTRARETMRATGVPVIPGSTVPVRDAAEARAEAERVGWPVLLKAAGGGGGRGMRGVRSADEMEGALRAARSEAGQSFGDDRVYVERWLERPRHIEVQILADGLGSTMHLGERECSIQRRHQKLVEESPSPAVDVDLRERMGEVAVRAARAVGYRSAGTVEFLVQDGEFFFLEMNTRIQVEHPVTEMVTGVDLVREQIRIAAGQPLECRPDPAWPNGHALECRISAEDPAHGFLPSTGRIELLHAPAGPGVRWECGVSEGFTVGPHYDPLLAKLIVHAPTRSESIARMRRALGELRIGGPATTQAFHVAVLEESDFLAGRLSVRYVEDHPELLAPPLTEETRRLAAAAAVALEEERRVAARAGPTGADHRPSGDSGFCHRRSDWQRAFEPE